MRFSKRLLGFLFVLGAIAQSAFAVPKYYEIAGGSINGNLSDPGLVVHTEFDAGLAGRSFTLNDGGSSTFSFFDIWTNETTVNDDDIVLRSISATLNFSDPLTGATVNGVTFGGRILFGIGQWGQIRWQGPTTITLGDRVFSVSLSDEIFNAGLFGLFEGEGCGATIKATITQISSAIAVPEGGQTLLLLGLASTTLLLIPKKRLESAPNSAPRSRD